MASHVEHEKSDYSTNSENALTRQVTVQMSAEQYEKLFFQPTPARGDLAKRLGNPTLLGVLGFLIPYTTTMMTLMQWKGTSAATCKQSKRYSESWFSLLMSRFC